MRLHKAKRRATYMPDQQCPVPMDKLEEYRRIIARKHDGTTEDFEEKLHSLEHSQQKRMLHTAWKGEMWFKVKKNARHQSRIPTQTPSSQARPAPDQQQPEQGQERRRYTQKKPARQTRWQQAVSNGQAMNNDHTQQQASQGQRNFQQLRTTDYWICEGHLWKESTSSPEHNPTYEQNPTYHNNTRQTRCYQAEPWRGQQSSGQHQEQDVQDL